MKIFVVLCVLGVLFVTVCLAGAATFTVEVSRVVRPHILEVEVRDGDRNDAVRVKLAGVVPPLGHPELYQEAMQVLRDDLVGFEVVFDFALGFTEEKKPWVGYLFFEDEERGWVSINEALIESGYARVDERTAGENHLAYLLALQEEARENAWGIWAFEEAWRKSSGHDAVDCPGCIIR